MIGSLINLANELTDEELALLVELAISAVNGERSHEIAMCAERLACARESRRMSGTE